MNNIKEELVKELVSFGNYLLSKERTQSVSEQVKQWVTHADLSNWEHTYYPSRYKHGDKVILNFFTSGTISNCKIIKVHFTESKVLYDVEVEMIIKNDIEGDKPYHTRLYNIDSLFVSDYINPTKS